MNSSVAMPSADRRELGQGGRIEYRIGDDHHVSGTGAHHGLTPGDVVHGACDALNGHQIAGLDYAAQHQAEAADDVGDCILQTQRDRHTSNTKGGDKCGRIDAEYGCSTIAAPVTQMVTRVRFTKIEALGI